MKLQHIAIIFVIIILPISLVVGEYIQTQINTIALQTAYSSKLQTATYDAIKSFRLNTVNNKYSSVSDSKIRDIEASVNTFYTSLGREIEADGYGADDLSVYTPALLYTLYDGYYIYSKYYNESIGQYQYGLKPYIYYSCRYVYKEKNIDIVVNYTLDNYITIYGYVGNAYYVTKTGSIINPDNIDKGTKEKINKGEDIESLTYCGVKIEKEVTEEQIVYLDDNRKPQSGTFSYIVYDNNKVYYERIEENEEKEKDKFFTINSEYKKQYVIDKEVETELRNKLGTDENGKYVIYNDSAVKYYVEAYKFSTWVRDNLNGITQANAVDENGNTIGIGDEVGNFSIDTESNCIFDCENFNDANNHDSNSNITDTTFDLNRIAVIRRSIQTNLLTAIANYNHSSSNTSYEYVLPMFSEEAWYKIANNISVVSFLQGIPIGTKYFNDYCVMINNMNKEVVTLDTLYVITEDEDENGNKKEEVHLLGCKDIIDNKLKVKKVYKNIDFERQTVVISENNEVYYYPHYALRCYDCLVNAAQTYDIDFLKGNVKEYDAITDSYTVTDKNKSDTFEALRKEVLTAYARESYDLYRVNEYFKGNDEAIDIEYINKYIDEDIDNNSIKIVCDWKPNHKANVIATKGNVEGNLKIQYHILSNNSVSYNEGPWIESSKNNNDGKPWGENENGVVTIHNLWAGAKIAFRLNNGTYTEYETVYTVPREDWHYTEIRIFTANDDKDDINFYNNNNTIPHLYYNSKDGDLTARVINGTHRDEETLEANYEVIAIEGGENLKGNLSFNPEDARLHYSSEISKHYYDISITKDGNYTVNANTLYESRMYLESKSETTVNIIKDTVAPNAPTMTLYDKEENIIEGTNFISDEVDVEIITGQDQKKDGYASGGEVVYFYISDGIEEDSNIIVGTKELPIKYEENKRIHIDINYIQVNGESTKYTIGEDQTVVIHACTKDLVGNQSEWEEYIIPRDKKAPEIYDLYASDVLSDVSGSGWNGYNEFIDANITRKYKTGSFNANIVVSDDSSGIDEIEWEVYKDGELYIEQITKHNKETNQITVSLPIENLTSGEYIVKATVKDKVGNHCSTDDLKINLKIKILKLDRNPILVSNPSSAYTNKNVLLYIKNDMMDYLKQYSCENAGYDYNLGIEYFVMTKQEYDKYKRYTPTDKEFKDFDIYNTEIIQENSIVFYRFKYKDDSGNIESNLQTLNIDNIDKEAPGKVNVRINRYSVQAEYGRIYEFYLNANDNTKIEGYEWRGYLIPINDLGENGILENGYMEAGKKYIAWSDGTEYVMFSVMFRAIDSAGNKGPWSYNDSEYIELKIDAKGGSLSRLSDDNIRYIISNEDGYKEVMLQNNSEVKLKFNLTKSGYKFIGWEGTEDLKISQDLDGKHQIIIPKGYNKDIKIKAIWEKL